MEQQGSHGLVQNHKEVRPPKPKSLNVPWDQIQTLKGHLSLPSSNVGQQFFIFVQFSRLKGMPNFGSNFLFIKNAF